MLLEGSFESSFEQIFRILFDTRNSLSDSGRLSRIIDVKPSVAEYTVCAWVGVVAVVGIIFTKYYYLFSLIMFLFCRSIQMRFCFKVHEKLASIYEFIRFFLSCSHELCTHAHIDIFFITFRSVHAGSFVRKKLFKILFFNSF